MRPWERVLPALIAGVVMMSAPVPAEETTAYGQPLSAAEPIRISELLREPESYVGMTVKVEGLVDDVCPMEGCWIDILEEQTETTVRFKVEDGVIAFPAEARGRAVVAEGVLRKRELSKAQAVAWMRHLAEERGEPFDESSVTQGMVLYQLEGIGAHLAAAPTG